MSRSDMSEVHRNKYKPLCDPFELYIYIILKWMYDIIVGPT